MQETENPDFVYNTWVNPNFYLNVRQISNGHEQFILIGNALNELEHELPSHHILPPYIRGDCYWYQYHTIPYSHLYRTFLILSIIAQK